VLAKVWKETRRLELLTAVVSNSQVGGEILLLFWMGFWWFWRVHLESEFGKLFLDDSGSDFNFFPG